MDTVTQGLLGGAVAQAAFGHKLKKDAWKIGAVGGLIADLDTPIARLFSSSPLVMLEWHRHFTHALIFIPIGGLITALLFLWLKKYRAQWKMVLAAATLGYATHAPLDILTSYGTLFFWPFTNYRVELDFYSIVEPIFTLTLFIGLVWAVLKNSTKPARIALILCALYICLSAFQHQRVMHYQNILAHQRGHQIERGRAIPTVGNYILWRSLYEANGKLYADAIRVPLFSKAQVRHGSSVQRVTLDQINSDPTLSPLSKKYFAIYNWFTAAYVAYIPKMDQVLGDMRLTSSPDSMRSIWGIQFDPKTGVKMINLYQGRKKAFGKLWQDLIGRGEGFKNIN